MELTQEQEERLQQALQDIYGSKLPLESNMYLEAVYSDVYEAVEQFIQSIDHFKKNNEKEVL